MHNKNIEIANLVFNWLKTLETMGPIKGLTTFWDQDDTPFSLEYLQSKFIDCDISNIPENVDAQVHIYINEESGLIQLIDDETWHNQWDGEIELDICFSLELPDLSFIAHVD